MGFVGYDSVFKIASKKRLPVFNFKFKFLLARPCILSDDFNRKNSVLIKKQQNNVKIKIHPHATKPPLNQQDPLTKAA
jgi:hypothetical protein